MKDILCTNIIHKIFFVFYIYFMIMAAISDTMVMVTVETICTTETFRLDICPGF